jgi:hypothetical protein
MAAPAKRKKAPLVDVKSVMSALDRKDREFYTQQAEQEQKSISMWLMMRYASSAQGTLAPHYIIMINELVNKHFNELSKHPELQWLLMTASGAGKPQYHPYLKPPRSNRKRDRLTDLILRVYPGLNSQEVDLLKSINSTQDLIQLALDHGCTDKEIQEIFS